MNYPTNPSQVVLDANFGYIYRITNTLTGFVYIGMHQHVKGERWRDYLGSGFRIQDEQVFLGRDFFSKELVCWTKSRIDAEIKEATHITRLVQSDTPHYNISNFDGALYATTPEQIQAMTAFRLSHESWNFLTPQRYRLQSITSSDLPDADIFDVQLRIIEEAIALKTARQILKRSIAAG
ncbi:hypothetical protein BC477_02570 [Clavibacter michiganensis subsp. michiganensis]|uniref:Putative endonuclease SegE-like GIY-YIG domain-containing protein n=2 Tax=Clavibacter michiganensis subsp. michiganensis TaxID=33013 RepID=A0A251XJ74_CLAMM|nr:hypothetical protein BC477_02570 [Clavibacter michiganensis subsp. michiganensis]OUE03594.1 hypothetical protein CMMCAS07_01505 [Clavibacter michiganensis subsp. michiganensis]